MAPTNLTLLNISLSESEGLYKKYLIKKLNKINIGWVDGDKNNNKTKTTDLINKTLNIAIEIKDDTTYKHKFPSATERGARLNNIDISKKSEQLKSHARDANKKFRNYPNFKTILLIRTELVNIPFDIIGYIFNGMLRFTKIDGKLVKIGKKNEFLSFTSTKEIGSYLLFGNNSYYYIENPNANPCRIVSRYNLEKHLSETIENIPFK